MFARASSPSTPTDPVSELLARVLQTKTRSIELQEEWLKKTRDFEISAGLTGHVADERRHLRLLTDEIKRRGGKPSGRTLDQLTSKPFLLVSSQPDELLRLYAFHHGIKGSIAMQCARLVGYVDVNLGRVLELITRDEERHIRWADVRFARSAQAVPAGREVDAFLRRVEDAMTALWSRPWMRLSTQGRRSA